MEPINVTGFLQEAGHPDSRACTRCQVYDKCFILPSTSTFTRLSHLYQTFYVHCVVVISGRGDWIGGGGSFVSGCGWGTEGNYYHLVVVFTCACPTWKISSIFMNSFQANVPLLYLPRAFGFLNIFHCHRSRTLA